MYPSQYEFININAPSHLFVDWVFPLCLIYAVGFDLLCDERGEAHVTELLNSTSLT